MLYYLATDVVSYPILSDMFFPYSIRSLSFVLALLVSDIVQDVFCSVVVSKQTGRRFEALLTNPFSKKYRVLPLSIYSGAVWPAFALVRIGWGADPIE